jgi:hypothetical protein
VGPKLAILVRNLIAFVGAAFFVTREPVFLHIMEMRNRLTGLKLEVVFIDL